MRLLPCVALTGISFGLIKVLSEKNLRRQRLRVDVDRYHNRTTRMLLAVLMLFLLTEFPSDFLPCSVEYWVQTFLTTCTEF
ncbi:hypothetical protein CEXT_148501 [Caerostris extrusa]|uniref:Uncharacterized protein n=1 Tax=Caerostris extrusa TaxID=172846 RepID=A0AAV4UZH0_CAEEX|nr:hypothetical protein CEXT_148501 [Caerostris extrusa]